MTPPELRGRAVSFNTGVTRLSQVIGPALGGYVARGGGGALASAFYVRAGLAVGAALFVAAVGSCCQQRSAGSTAQRQGRAGAKYLHGKATVNGQSFIPKEGRPLIVKGEGGHVRSQRSGAEHKSISN